MTRPFLFYSHAHARARKGENRKVASERVIRHSPRQYTRAGLTDDLLGAYELAISLRDTGAALDAILAIAELNGLQIDSVEIQYEIQATLAELE
jgi:hypothetical protein